MSTNACERHWSCRSGGQQRARSVEPKLKPVPCHCLFQLFERFCTTRWAALCPSLLLIRHIHTWQEEHMAHRRLGDKGFLALWSHEYDDARIFLGQASTDGQQLVGALPPLNPTAILQSCYGRCRKSSLHEAGNTSQLYRSRNGHMPLSPYVDHHDCPHPAVFAYLRPLLSTYGSVSTLA